MGMACTRCGGTKFRSYCVKCDPDYAKEIATLRARAEKAEAALEKIRDWRPGMTYGGKVFDAQEIAKEAITRKGERR